MRAPSQSQSKKSVKLLLRYNLISAVFLGLFSIPGIGTEWLDFVLPASCFAVIPLLLTIREEYKRRQVDEKANEEEE